MLNITLSILASAAPAGISPSVDLIAAVGQAATGADGLPIVTLNYPFTNGKGEVGFTGAINNGTSIEHFVWFDGGVTWRNGDEDTLTLSGAESTMGISDAGDFAYSPSYGGLDAIWTQAGPILVEDDLAPDVADRYITSLDRPMMLPDGRTTFVAGLADAPGTTTLLRSLYEWDGSTFTTLMTAGDLIGGIPIQPAAGIGFDYHRSDNGAHLIGFVLLDTGSTNDDGAVHVDGQLIARENHPLFKGSAEDWDNFDSVSINNDGRYVFSGDTAGPTESDEFIAVDGAIALREGMMIAGETLGGNVLGASINNLDNVLHAWQTGTGEAVFLSDADDLAGTAERLIGTGDLIDTDNDGIGDHTVTDIESNTTLGPAFSLGEDGFAYVTVDLQAATGGSFRAVIRLDAFSNSACLAADVDLSGVVDFNDLLSVLAAWGDCLQCPEDITEDGVVGFDDLLAVLANWGPC